MGRFRPPWKVEALDRGFKVVDGNKQAVAYVYGLTDSRDARIAKSLTRDEARRIASNIAKLPDLLGKRSCRHPHHRHRQEWGCSAPFAMTLVGFFGLC
jgi:hypothetical protein